MDASHAKTGRRLLWLWLTAGAGTGGVALFLLLGIAVAVFGASFTGCQPGSEPALAATGPIPSAYALQSIPPERLKIYEEAGARFDIDWSFLASIGAQECGSGTCAGINPSGCAGPMQIAFVRGSPCSPEPGPTLWEQYEVSAHPGQPASVNDPADAIYTAAKILREDKGAPPTGGTYNEYHQAACRYFGACANATVSYAAEVMARATQYGFTGAGAPPPTNTTLSEAPTSGQCATGFLAPEPGAGKEIVRVAETQLGQREYPPASNCTPYGACEEWCSLFTAWVWQHAGVDLPGPTGLYAYSGSLYTWAKEHGGRILPPTARPSPGDAVFYGEGPNSSVHVGIVQRVYPDGQITEIDGNDDHNEVGIAGPLLPNQATIEGEHIYGYAQPPTTQPRG